jgi:hypothetical protein
MILPTTPLNLERSIQSAKKELFPAPRLTVGAGRTTIVIGALSLSANARSLSTARRDRTGHPGRRGSLTDGRAVQRRGFCVAIDARISEFWVDLDGYEPVANAVNRDGYAGHAHASVSFFFFEKGKKKRAPDESGARECQRPPITGLCTLPNRAGEGTAAPAGSDGQLRCIPIAMGIHL